MQKTPFSLYQQEAPSLRFTPKQGPGYLYDVLILGGGFSGISAALEAAKAGLTVAVIEGFEIGNGGSGRNGGHLLPDWPTDFSKLAKHLTPEEADAAFAIGMDTVSLAKDRIARYNIACDLQLGYVHCAYHDGHVRDLEDMQRAYEARGISGLTYLGDKNALHTHLGTDAYVAGLYEDGAGHINPLKYLQGLAKAAASEGADIFQNQLVEDIVISQNEAPHELHCQTGDKFFGRHLLICGNGYIQKKAPKKMQRTLANVTSSILATQPLSDNLIKSLMPTRVAASDGNTALNYYRIDAQGRMIFGGRASYLIPDDPAVIGHDLRRRMLSVFPELETVETAHIWSGRIGITTSRVPEFGTLGRGCYFVQGFSGHGVALSGMAGKILADHITETSNAFQTLTKIRHLPFPGGPLRTPILALGMAYYKLRDKLRL